jgi:two-component system LytT family response regulator
MKKIRVLIVDDEPPARKKLRMLLRHYDNIDLVGEASNGIEAVQLVETAKPDLLLLDIQMPELNGFEVLEALGENRPHVIFTTAYDQYAIKAFEVRALDYLLKPFDGERLREALIRAESDFESWEKSGWSHQLDDLLSEIRNSRSYLRRILMKSGGKIIVIDTNQIQWISAEEKYVRLHTDKRSYLHRETMNHLENRLDPALFVRVHRGQIVNMEFISGLEGVSHGDYQIVMRDGSRIPLGRTYRDRFLKQFSENTL